MPLKVAAVPHYLFFSVTKLSRTLCRAVRAAGDAMGMEVAMSRSRAPALLVMLMIAALAPVLGACANYPGVEHRESAVLPNPI